jgi:hypothetical protein
MAGAGERPELPIPGWYADPEAPGGLRYWDGSAWAESRVPPPEASGYPSVPPPPMPKTSGRAIASLVLGIVWMYGITSVLAIIFALLAKRDIREANGWVTGGGMATAGLVLGIVGVVGIVVVILLAVLVDTEFEPSNGYRYE